MNLDWFCEIELEQLVLLAIPAGLLDGGFGFGTGFFFSFAGSVG